MNALFLTHQRLVRGMTLIELLITLSLTTVLVVLATPGMQSMMASSKLTSATNELSSSLARARSESMRYGTRMTVCKANTTGAQCSVMPTAGWEAGWLTFQDPTRTGTPSVDPGETITFRIEPLAPDLKITGNGLLENYVSFASDGRSKTLANAGLLMGKIRVCSTSTALDDDARARDLVLSATGRISIDKPPGVSASCPAPI